MSARAVSGGRRSRAQKALDRIFHYFTGAWALLIFAVLIAFVAVLLNTAEASINRFGLSYLTTAEWDPGHQVFGVVPFVAGTLITSAIALLIGIPLSLGAAIFLTELAPRWLREPLTYLIDLLAAVPSVIYGLWAFYVLRPVVRAQVEPFLESTLGHALTAAHLPDIFGTPSASGLDVFTASLILAVMVVPTISAISRESLLAVPSTQREAVLGLGGTRWEVTRVGVLPYARSGIFGAAVLGLGRALGETMAVTMTIGNSNHVPSTLFSSGQTIASGIASQFTEVSSHLELSALVEAGLVLLVIGIAVNAVARLMIIRLTRAAGGERGE